MFRWHEDFISATPARATWRAHQTMAPGRLSGGFEVGGVEIGGVESYLILYDFVGFKLIFLFLTDQQDPLGFLFCSF